jgi:hypothetical protein
MKTDMQFIGAFITDGNVLSFSMGAGFEKLGIETQVQILEFCRDFLGKIIDEMDDEADALKDGAKAASDYVPSDNAAIEGAAYEAGDKA